MDNSVAQKPNSFYDFSVNDRDGNSINLNKYSGQVCVVINMSDRDELCIELLNLLSDIQSNHNDFHILLFPCFQIGPQGSCDKLIALVKQANIKRVTVFEEIQINGGDTSPLYKYMKRCQPGRMGGFINANGTIFIINRKGVPIDRIVSSAGIQHIENTIVKHL